MDQTAAATIMPQEVTYLCGGERMYALYTMYAMCAIAGGRVMV